MGSDVDIPPPILAKVDQDNAFVRTQLDAVLDDVRVAIDNLGVDLAPTAVRMVLMPLALNDAYSLTILMSHALVRLATQQQPHNR